MLAVSASVLLPHKYFVHGHARENQHFCFSRATEKYKKYGSNWLNPTHPILHAKH
jgi:hypothetical protein